MKRFKVSLFLVALSTLLALHSNSQEPVKNYTKEWAKVEEFIKKKLPKSALVEVKKIYALAKKEKQDAQIVKALIMMSELQAETREEDQVLSIKEIEKEITISKEPVVSLLNSLLAEKYWNYYQRHRWEFYNRTQTREFKKDDITTWGAEDFHKKVSALYLASVQNEKLLQQTKLQPYDAIIIKGNVRHLRPTLFDLLAHRALSYFENDERDINRPAYAFEIDQASAFDPAADFVTRRFPTKDSLSLHHKALLLYQKLIAFHLNDVKADALIDADIQRIEFVKNKSVHPDKDQLYFNAINHIARQYENMPAAAQAWFLLADWYNTKAWEYKAYGDSTHRLDRIKAKEICEKIITQKDSSEGKINCYNLLKEINASSYQFSIEKVNVPDQPFRASVQYRNVNSLYFRLIKPDEKLVNNMMSSEYQESYWTSIINAKSLKSWQQPLPATNDFQQHVAEIKIDALPSGEYILLASNDKDFKSMKSILGARLFYVSNISFVNSGDDFFVLNRDNGSPLANASVQVWEQKYDYTVSRSVFQKEKLYRTNTNGFFRMEKKKAANNQYVNFSYQLDITHNNDHFFMNEMVSNSYYYRDNNEKKEKTTLSINLFMDRSIYRPGQTVYFKGIVLQKNNETNKSGIVADYDNTVYLNDANGQVIDSMKVKSNEFGSFSGRFQLPQAGLNGAFLLRTKKDNGQSSFRVEEYKRPKFYVDYEPIKGTYKVNDKITITGIAKSYAGNNIDGAVVKYRVVRQPRFLYPWLFWRWWQPPAEPMEIVNGEIQTDKDGKFKVEFTAIPDLKIAKKFEPVFDYIVYADVTDINGETRSGNKTVSVSYKALLVKMNIPETLVRDSLKSISIRTENMNGEHESATVKVTITKLKEEKRLIRQRYWQRPDQFIMNKEEYIRFFPHDEYDNENDSKSWEKDAIVLEDTFTTAENKNFTIVPGKIPPPGFYTIEITTKDKNGEVVKDIQYVELFDEAARQLNRAAYLWINARKQTTEPGEKALFEVGTSADNIFLIQEIDKSSYSNKNAFTSYTFSRLNNEKKTIILPAPEDNLDGYDAGWLFVKHNRFYVQSKTVSASHEDEKLKIEYATYRDKTLPGSEEKWKLKISGYKNEKVAAEVLASMYDASLDQFYPHEWGLPGYLHAGYGTNWQAAVNFSAIESLHQYINQETKYVDKRYDYLFFSSRPELYFAANGKATRGAPLAFDAVAPQAGISVSSRRGERAEELLKKLPGIDVDSDGFAAALETIKTSQQQSTQQPSGEVKIRKNFNETAFFFPDLRTDSDGAIEFSFTMPEALTKWKFQALAHTKNAAFGHSSKEIVTQKELMAQPNAPRFLREGDKIAFSSKIVNLSEKELTGHAELQLIDATTNQPVDAWFKNTVRTKPFTIAAGQSTAVEFPIEIPTQFNKALVWRIVARAGVFSDGEENAMPVLTNRTLVTETLPLWIRGTGTKNFSFDKLVQSGNSKTLQHHLLTVEYTSNPAWYAVQALPYLMEYPYDCAEQTWNRYYANSLATFIANSSPKIKQIFEQWKIKDTAALMSNLQKNEELKAVLLEETPWVLQARTEAEQKKNIALLFDMIRMSRELNNSFEKLRQMQSSIGGFVWFKGGPDDRYITQYIITGIGHLRKLKGIAAGQEDKLKQILATAIPYLDKKIKDDYDNLIKNKVNLKTYGPGYNEIQYLYMRSFFPDYKIPAATQPAYTYFRTRVQQTWVSQNKYMQGMIVLALGRTGDIKTPAAILKSLKETSISNEELGMYWKDTRRGWWWYEAPVERQALLIEAFQEIGKDNKTADDLRTWLLKNKQTNNWESTKATAEACYALLLQGTEWLANEPSVSIQLGSTTFRSTDETQQAGTGYFKKTTYAEKIKPEMGNITLTVGSSQLPLQGDLGGSWGSVYWQYFEDLDKITTASTPLSLVKKLFVETNSDRGPVLTPVKDGDNLKIGDKIKVRIELRVDREMEYVHMKDMRASALEPVNVLSSYKWQGGMGYYETTKDASTSFFFSSLRRGTYVFEYPLFVTHAGNFSNGITSIQCMYAPEFSSHSEGIRINVK
jgi:hypothetical protein